MNQRNKRIVLIGAVIAVLLAVLAPFLASTNPDGLDKNIIDLVGGGSEEKAAHIIGEKDRVNYEAPFSDYRIAGMEKTGEVLALLIGTIMMLALGLGISSFLKKKKEIKRT